MTIQTNVSSATSHSTILANAPLFEERPELMESGDATTSPPLPLEKPTIPEFIPIFIKLLLNGLFLKKG